MKSHIKAVIEIDLRTLAKYPYSAAARAYAKAEGPTLEELLGDVMFAPARSRGMERAHGALDGSSVPEHAFATESQCIMELLSYVYARILVSGVDEPFLTRRYALGEAVLAYARLQKEQNETVLDLAAQFDMLIERPSDAHRYPGRHSGNETETSAPRRGDLLHFADFLKNSGSLRSPEWKMINRDMRAGWIAVEKRELCRLMQEYLRKKIETELPLELSLQIIETVRGDIDRLTNETQAMKRELQPDDVGEVTLELFPPCMKQLLAMTQAGENLAHSARFALAAFLHHLGLSTDDIINVYSASPDFDPSKARYQIDHVTGEISGTEYLPPDCSTMKSYGICYNPDSLCKMEWMKHPLYYYRLKMKHKMRDEREGETGEGTGAGEETTEGEAAGADAGSKSESEAATANGSDSGAADEDGTQKQRKQRKKRKERKERKDPASIPEGIGRSFG